MSSLDLPQHLYYCRLCDRTITSGVCQHEPEYLSPTPTLLYADFQAYMTALSLAFDPMPRDADVWDRLESCTDTAPTNREAIDNAIRWVVSQR